EEQVRVVVGVLRHEVPEQRALGLFAPRREVAELGRRELAQLRVVAVAELLGRGDILLEPLVRGEVFRHRPEPRVLSRQLAKALLVGDPRGVTEHPSDLFVTLDQPDELLAQRILHLAPASCSNRIRWYGMLNPRFSSAVLTRSSMSLRTAP